MKKAILSLVIVFSVTTIYANTDIGAPVFTAEPANAAVPLINQAANDTAANPLVATTSAAEMPATVVATTPTDIVVNPLPATNTELQPSAGDKILAMTENSSTSSTTTPALNLDHNPFIKVNTDALIQAAKDTMPAANLKTTTVAQNDFKIVDCTGKKADSLTACINKAFSSNVGKR